MAATTQVRLLVWTLPLCRSACCLAAVALRAELAARLVDVIVDTEERSWPVIKRAARRGPPGCGPSSDSGMLRRAPSLRNCDHWLELLQNMLRLRRNVSSLRGLMDKAPPSLLSALAPSRCNEPLRRLADQNFRRRCGFDPRRGHASWRTFQTKYPRLTL